MPAAQKNRPCQLYRHYDSDGNLLYIGISVSALGRMESHKRKSSWFKKIATIKVEHFKTRFEAEKAEAKAIQQESPRYNKVHRPKQGPEQPHFRHVPFYENHNGIKTLVVHDGQDIDEIIKRSEESEHWPVLWDGSPHMTADLVLKVNP